MGGLLLLHTLTEQPQTHNTHEQRHDVSVFIHALFSRVQHQMQLPVSLACDAPPPDGRRLGDERGVVHLIVHIDVVRHLPQRADEVADAVGRVAVLRTPVPDADNVAVRSYCTLPKDVIGVSATSCLKGSFSFPTSGGWHTSRLAPMIVRGLPDTTAPQISSLSSNCSPIIASTCCGENEYRRRYDTESVTGLCAGGKQDETGH